MNVDRTVRQLYMHYGVSVSSSKFCSLGLGGRRYSWEEWMRWNDDELVRIPKDKSLQYCEWCFGSWESCREEEGEGLNTTLSVAVIQLP